MCFLSFLRFICFRGWQSLVDRPRTPRACKYSPSVRLLRRFQCCKSGPISLRSLDQLFCENRKMSRCTFPLKVQTRLPGPSHSPSFHGQAGLCTQVLSHCGLCECFVRGTPQFWGHFWGEKDEGDDATVVSSFATSLTAPRCEDVDVTSRTNTADFTLQRGTPQLRGGKHNGGEAAVFPQQRQPPQREVRGGRHHGEDQQGRLHFAKGARLASGVRGGRLHRSSGGSRTTTCSGSSTGFRGSKVDGDCNGS